MFQEVTLLVQQLSDMAGNLDPVTTPDAFPKLEDERYKVGHKVFQVLAFPSDGG